MYEILEETLKNAYKPYDVVSDSKGNVGFISEVSVNSGQSKPEYQISYCVNWMVGDNRKYAWFNHCELTKHCNIFVKIAEQSCHPFGSNASKVKNLFKVGF